MQLSTRAVELRAALESAADSPAEVTAIGPTRIRIAVPIHARLPHRQFQDALAAVQQGDDWGTSGITGTVTVWAEVASPGGPRHDAHRPAAEGRAVPHPGVLRRPQGSDVASRLPHVTGARLSAPHPRLGGRGLCLYPPRQGAVVMPSMAPRIHIPEATGTAPGNCRNCGKWSANARIVREVHSDSGAGATVVQCCEKRRPAAEQPRTYSL